MYLCSAGDAGEKGDKGDRGEDGVGIKGSPGTPGAPGKARFMSSLEHIAQKEHCKAALNREALVPLFIEQGAHHVLCSLQILIDFFQPISNEQIAII